MTFTSTTIRELRALGLDQDTFDKVLEIFERAQLSKPKKKGNAEDRAARGSRLQADWALPAEWREWALRLGLRHHEIDREAIKFKNYWLNCAGAKGIKLNWQLTWQTWCDRTLERLGREPNRADGQPPRAVQGPEAFSPQAWAAIAKRVKAGAPWSHEWGPPPGRMDCLMPAGLL